MPSRARYRHTRLADPREFDPRSFRTVTRGGRRVIVGCPRGQWDARRGRCAVAMRAQAILTPVIRNPVWGPAETLTLRHRHRGAIVHGYRIIGTNVYVYGAWEPSSWAGPHSSVTSFDGRVYGKIGTRRLPPHLERLPAMSDARIRAVRRFHQQQYRLAYGLIYSALPGLRSKTFQRRDGEVVSYHRVSP